MRHSCPWQHLVSLTSWKSPIFSSVYTQPLWAWCHSIAFAGRTYLFYCCSGHDGKPRGLFDEYLVKGLLIDVEGNTSNIAFDTAALRALTSHALEGTSAESNGWDLSRVALCRKAPHRAEAFTDRLPGLPRESVS